MRNEYTQRIHSRAHARAHTSGDIISNIYSCTHVHVFKGLCQIIITTPMEITKIRMQMYVPKPGEQVSDKARTRNHAHAYR